MQRIVKHRIQLLAGFVAACFQKQGEYAQAEYAIAVNEMAVADDMDSAIFAPVFDCDESRVAQVVAAWNDSRAQFKQTGKTWVHLSPYGDFDNAVGMQRVTREDADLLVRNFKSIANVGTRLMGLPFYIGHPDHPAYANQHKDEQSYGRVKELEAREDGIYGLVAFNSKGRQLIEDETFHGHSVHWILKRDGAVWRPVSLKSVGFTNSPNLDVKPITAANSKNTMDFLKELAKSLGLPEAADKATVEAKIASLKAAANELPIAQAKATELETKVGTLTTQAAAANAKAIEAEGKVAAADARVTTITVERDTARTEKATAETAAANAREVASQAVIDAGIRTGRITGAEKATFEGEFKSAANAESFTAVAKKISDRQPKLHVKTLTENVGAVNMKHHDKIQEFTNMVNSRMEKDKCDYDTAHSRTEQENPNFFGAAAK